MRASPQVLTVLLSVLLHVPGSTARASDFFFSRLDGPDGVTAGAVAAAPDGDLFALAEGSVFRRGFTAPSWGLAGSLPAPVTGLEVGPDGRIWGLGVPAVLVSDDEGTTWRTLPAAIPQILHLAFDTPLLTYAATTSGLYRSLDRGSSWTPLALPNV